MTDDAQLLRQYAEGSEAAFGELVSRYVNLVYSAALRQTGNVQHAQDVAQTVFTTLARKARALPGNVVLGGFPGPDGSGPERSQPGRAGSAGRNFPQLLPANGSGTTGMMKSGNLGAVTVGTGMIFGALLFLSLAIVLARAAQRKIM